MLIPYVELLIIPALIGFLVIASLGTSFSTARRPAVETVGVMPKRAVWTRCARRFSLPLEQDGG